MALPDRPSGPRLDRGESAGDLRGIRGRYATAWFSTPFFLLRIVFSFVYMFAARADRRLRPAALPAYPRLEDRQELFLVLGEQHHRVVALPAAEPRWLTIPERGLYLGTVIVGAVGTGKDIGVYVPGRRAAGGYRATDPTRNVGDLVVKVKGSARCEMELWRDSQTKFGSTPTY